MNSKAHLIKDKYKRLISDATNSGDFEQVMHLKEQMQKELNDLSKVAHTLGTETVERKQAKILRTEFTGLDLQRIITKSDIEIRESLNADVNFLKALQLMEAEQGFHDASRELQKNAIRLTPEMTPQLYNMANKCKTTLQLRASIDVNVYQDANYKGVCHAIGDDKLSIILSSSLIESFDPNELTFILGKLIGQFLFGHTQLSIQSILRLAHKHLSPIHAMKLYSWERSSQISSDRIGFLCSENFDHVAKTFFKLSSGLSMNNIHFNIAEYIEPFRNIRNEFSDDNIDPVLLHSTHPFSPIRIRALEFFNQSRVYKEISGNGNGNLTKENIEKRIDEVLNLVNPSYLQQETSLTNEIQEIVLLGGFAISLSNGVVEKSEVEALKSVIKPQVFVKLIKEVNGKNMTELWQMIRVRLESMKLHLTNNNKMGIIKDLALISYADGSIDDCEKKVIYQICDEVKVNRNFADQIFHKLASS